MRYRFGILFIACGFVLMALDNYKGTRNFDRIAVSFAGSAAMFSWHNADKKEKKK